MSVREAQKISQLLHAHDYESLEVLGQGGFAVAHLVRHRSTSVRYVAKVVELKQAFIAESAAMEVDVLKKFQDAPQVVRYVEHFIADTWLFIIMEYCEGGDLATLITKVKESDRTFPESVVIRFAFQLLCALARVHASQVMHRDMKAGNVFLTSPTPLKNTDPLSRFFQAELRVGDFGISKVMEYTMAQAHTLIGTGAYLAPEVCLDLPYTVNADLWGVGCILFEVCAGKRPYTATHFAGYIMKIASEPVDFSGLSSYSSALQDVIKSLLQKNPNDREPAAKLLSRPIFAPCFKDASVRLDPTVIRLVQQQHSLKMLQPHGKVEGTTTPVTTTNTPNAVIGNDQNSYPNNVKNNVDGTKQPKQVTENQNITHTTSNQPLIQNMPPQPQHSIIHDHQISQREAPITNNGSPRVNMYNDFVDGHAENKTRISNMRPAALSITSSLQTTPAPVPAQPKVVVRTSSFHNNNNNNNNNVASTPTAQSSYVLPGESSRFSRRQTIAVTSPKSTSPKEHNVPTESPRLLRFRTSDFDRAEREKEYNSMKDGSKSSDDNMPSQTPTPSPYKFSKLCENSPTFQSLVNIMGDYRAREAVHQVLNAMLSQDKLSELVTTDALNVIIVRAVRDAPSECVSLVTQAAELARLPE